MALKIKFTGFFVFLIGASLLLSSCSKVSKKSVVEKIVEGDWVVSYFDEDGVNQTGVYNGFTFAFDEEGDIVKASRPGTIITGSWGVTKDKGNDDSSSKFDFSLTFPAVQDVERLNADWEIVSQNDETLVLQDLSGSSIGTNYLTFTKF